MRQSVTSYWCVVDGPTSLFGPSRASHVPVVVGGGAVDQSACVVPAIGSTPAGVSTLSQISNQAAFTPLQTNEVRPHSDFYSAQCSLAEHFV